MYPYLGDFPTGATIFFPFHTFNSSGASVTLTGLAVTDIEVYKNASMTQRSSDAGYTLVDTDGIDLDSVTGIHGFTIDTSDNTDAGFFAAGNDYTVVVASVTVDSQTVNFIVGRFSIENRKVTANVTQWLGTAAATPTTAGVPEVDVTYWLGTAAATPTTAGVPEVDVTMWSGTAIPGVDTAGYPKVTVKSGTGTGEIALTSGYAGVNQTQPGQGTVRVLNGVTDQYIYFIAFSSTNHSSRVTGLSSFTVYRSRNGGTATAYTTPTITEVDSTNMPGLYKFLLDEDMTLDAGDYSQEMALHITASTMDPVTRTIEIYRRDVDAPVKGIALSDIPFYMVDSTDHVTPKTGLTVTATVSKDAGAFASAAGTATEIGSGLYQFDATAADMNADVVVFKFVGTAADPVLLTIKTVPG